MIALLPAEAAVSGTSGGQGVSGEPFLTSQLEVSSSARITIISGAAVRVHRWRAPARKGKIHPGADDNASGTAFVLELAANLAAERKGASRELQTQHHLRALERRRDRPRRQRRVRRAATARSRQGRGLLQLRHGRATARQQAHRAGRRLVEALAQAARETQRRRRLQPRAAGRSVSADGHDLDLSEAHSGAEFLHRRTRGLPSSDGYAREARLRGPRAHHQLCAKPDPRSRERARAARIRARRTERFAAAVRARRCALISAPFPITRPK